VTVRDITEVCLRLPEIPVMVTGNVPVVAVLLTLTVSVLALVVLIGLNATVTPEGTPIAESVTLPLKPFCPITLITLLPLAPRGIVSAEEEAERLKLGTTTDREIATVLVKVP
jgi:hypothetical protein